MTDPLTDARAFFGDAMGDRKQLRRAYARLIRTHTPDTDPERFQAIRAAYEAAQHALEHPDAAADAALDLDATIDALTPETFDATLARLTAQARTDTDAALTALFLVQATRPDTALDWIATQRREGMQDDALLSLVIAILDIRPALADAPLLTALRVTLDAGNAARLAGHRVRAFIREERYTDGFSLWRQEAGNLRALQPRTWEHVADAVLFYACERTPDDVLVDIEDAMEDVGLGLSDFAHDELKTGLRNARALKALAADPAAPSVLVEALRLGRRTSDPGAFASARQCRYALERMGDGDLDAGVLRLQLAHPNAYRLLREIEFQLTGRLGFKLEWVKEGAPPATLPPDLAEVVRARVERSRTAGPSVFDTLRAPLQILVAFVIVPLLFDLTLARTSALIGVVAGTFTFLVLWRRREAARRTIGPLVDDLDELQRLYGVWRHELFACLADPALELTDEDWWPLGEDRNADLRCLAPSHGFRASTPPPDDDEDDDDDAADDAEEDADEHST